MNQRVKHIVLRSARENDIFFAGLKDYSTQLKQHALLFDQIGILRLGNLREVMSSAIDRKGNKIDLIRPGEQTFISDTEWLEENGIIFEPKIETELQEKDIQRILQTKSTFASELRNLNKAIKYKLDEPEPKDVLDKHNSAREVDGIILRMMSLVMEVSRKTSVTTTLPYAEYAHVLPNTTISDVVQIVINKLPLPDNTTPWEKIVDYREDAESQNSLLALRRWIRKTSTQNLLANEIEEELEWLMNEFQSHMRLHKIKANTETLEVMVKAPLEIIENLIKLKFSKIPEPLFALKKRQINLMEAELNAPGREMAYIIKTSNTFQSQE
jgi:hypothetical protein